MNRAFRNGTPGFNARRQSGVVVIIVAFALAALIGMSGLALDGAHTMVSKTRLQNAVDASALSAAKTLDQTRGDTVLTEVEALAMFSDNASDLGNGEIRASYDANELNVAVEFSNTLIPFVSGSAPALYVRVTATNLRLRSWLLPVMGVSETVVDASAIAGPSTTLGRICNVAPMMVCAGPDPQLDPLAADYDPFFGFQANHLEVLKAGDPNQALEKGNFQLIRLDGATGGADAREALAGSYDACVVTDEEIQTEPGNNVGPVSQGLNTRLNVYSGPMQGTEAEYPPDLVVTQPAERLTLADDGETILYGTPEEVQQGTAAAVEWGSDIPYGYSDYDADLTNALVPKLANGIPGRRVIAMPVGVCGDEAGQSEIPFATVLCFYLIQEVNQGNDPHVFGQFTPNGCAVTGTAGPDPITGPGPYVIQLYKDPDNVES
jgi:Flp pilus assembly protein TadG